MTSIQKQRRRGKSQPSLLKNIFTISFFYNENMLLYFVNHRVPYTADECPQFACTFPLPFPAIPQAIPGTFEAISQDIAQDHQGKEGEGQCQGYAGMFTQPVAQGSFPFFQSFHGVPLQPQVDDAREDVQAVDHVGRDAAVQAVGVLQIAFADAPGGVGLHFLCDFQLFQLAQHVPHPAADLGRRAGGQFFAREAQVDALLHGPDHIVRIRMMVMSSREMSVAPAALRV